MTARRSTLEFDVARDRWREFLEEFSADHRSWLATVEHCDALGQTTDVLARELPLARVTLDDACGPARAIQITFAAEQGRTPPHLDVPDPIALRLVEAPGRAPSLEIHQTDDRCTRLRFRDVPLPELLDGVAPGEAEPLDAA